MDQPAQAVEHLQTLAAEPGRDQLAYLMELGLAQFYASQYEASVETLLRADELADFQDYFSVGKELESIVLSEGRVQYKGAAYENLLIHVYLALNFLALEDFEGARVEARRIYELMEKHRLDENAFAMQNAFARYLAGLLWQIEGNWDSAFIEYEQAARVIPWSRAAAEAAMRAAYFSGRNSALQELAEQFPDLNQPRQWQEQKNNPEVVVIFEKGWVPRKGVSPTEYSLPHLYPQVSPVSLMAIEYQGDNGEIDEVQSAQLFSVENTAMQTLQRDYLRLVAKRVAGRLAKEAIAKEVSDENELAGLVLYIAMLVSDRADLRQWALLPEAFQVARVKVPAGARSLRLIALSSSNSILKERKIEVDLKPGEIKVIPWRVFQ